MIRRIATTRRRGQGMAENIITVALIAIATIGITSLFGDNVRGLFAASSDSLAGASQVGNPGTRISGKSALTQKKISNFAQTNSVGGVSGGGGAQTNSPAK